MNAEITSTANPRVKEVLRLRERRGRDKTGLFLIEGRPLLDRAIERGLDVIDVFHRDDHDPPRGVPATPVAPDVLARMSYKAGSQDLVAVVRQFATTLSAFEPHGDPALLAVAESIEKPGNLGAMIRSVDAVGADGLIAIGESVDSFNPNVVRSSMGTILSVPLAITSLDALRDWLDSRGIRLVAACPNAGTPYWEADLTAPSAIVVGSEHTGLSRRALAIADVEVSIPMAGSVDSLNASVSLALLLYEARRQRAH